MDNKKLDYASAGVDIAAADSALEKVKLLAKSTFNESVLSEIGSFGGFFKPNLTGFKNPVFVSSTDGVGTKLKLAFLSNRHDTIGQDLVNHCINDILVHGARPLFFLDYIGVGKLKPETIVSIVDGLSRACKSAGVALIGGEMAELPDFYSPGEYDVAGCIVGMVDQDNIINGSNIKEGDVIIGLGSTGLHTNGFTLARKIAFEVDGRKFDEIIDSLGQPIGEALMTVHKTYLHDITPLLGKYQINGMAHITGGGIKGNLIRVIPENLRAVINKKSWTVPPIFEYLQRAGAVEDDAMYEAFNMGIGFMIVLPEMDAENVYNNLKNSGAAPYFIGKIESGKKEIILKD
jgi:phosphoribosylformylglycinamidine cyclo-ligase